ncbi:MAG: hypothetical protein JKY46_08625 [Robiginitomaculum sp.]|nr:hypothetical protein [Robiginitomaculum sp.]
MRKQIPIQTVAESLPEITLQRRFEFAAKGFVFNDKTMSMEEENPDKPTPSKVEQDDPPVRSLRAMTDFLKEQIAEAQSPTERDALKAKLQNIFDEREGLQARYDALTKPEPAQETAQPAIDENDPNTPSPEEQIAKTRADQEKLQAHQRQLSGAAEAAGEMTSAVGAQAEMRGDTQDAKEKTRKNQTDTQLLLEALRNDLQNELNRIEERRDDINEMRGGIEDVFENGYDLGEDGKITNEQAEKALREYEERTGQTVDRNNEAAVYAAFADQWKAFEREEAQMNKRAKEIDNFIEKDLPEAERKLNDPSVSQAEKDRDFLETSTKAKGFMNNGADDIETKIIQQESGYEGQANGEAQKTMNDANSYSATFR